MGKSPEPQRELEWLALDGRQTGQALCDEQINLNRKRPPVLGGLRRCTSPDYHYQKAECFIGNHD